MYFDNLALSLRDRFQQQGAASDLDEDIDHHGAELLLCPPVILVGPRLNNLAVSLGSRSQVSNLTEMRSLSSIELHYYVLTVTLIDPCLSIIFLPALETDLCNSTSRLTSMSLVVLHYFSVPSVILIGVSLDNLAIDLQTRFQMWDVPSDLDEMFRIYLQLI